MLSQLAMLDYYSASQLVKNLLTCPYLPLKVPKLSIVGFLKARGIRKSPGTMGFNTSAMVIRHGHPWVSWICDQAMAPLPGRQKGRNDASRAAPAN